MKLELNDEVLEQALKQSVRKAIDRTESDAQMYAEDHHGRARERVLMSEYRDWLQSPAYWRLMFAARMGPLMFNNDDIEPCHIKAAAEDLAAEMFKDKESEPTKE